MSAAPPSRHLMRYRQSLAALALLSLAACTPGPSSTSAASPSSGTVAVTAPGRPRLVVMLVVDQLRPSLLTEYDDLYTGGFRRLLDRGRFYTRASHDFGVTETAAGHATLATGVHPSRHGVVANEWLEETPAGWRPVSNVGDSTVKIVGAPTLRGVSPHYALRGGIAEWMVATDPASQVASVSGKDRGAVQPASHVRNAHVYWFSGAAGRFVTSTYYRDQYPAWAEEFQRQVMPRYLADSVWESTVPHAARARTVPDSVPYEGDGVRSYFPHRYVDEGRPGAFWSWFEGTPMLDEAVLDFARAMVTSLRLGADGSPDFLNISLSQTDRIGHGYGQLSREVLDNLLRADRHLGSFFEFLDGTVGRDGWVIGVSADHGALIPPENLPWKGDTMLGHRVTRAERTMMDSIRAASLRRASDPGMPRMVLQSVKQLPIIADAWLREDLFRAPPASDSFAVLMRRSMYPGREGTDFGHVGVVVRYIEGYTTQARGSGHGSPYWHDRHVPIIFMGPGIPAGRDPVRASTNDFAPTLARLVRVPFPGDLDGRPLYGVVGAQ